MEPLHISEADAVRDLAAILKRVQAGAEIVIERDAQPLAVIRRAEPARRTISECIALAQAHEKESGQAPVLDADFAGQPSDPGEASQQTRTQSYRNRLP
jgi:antitoxin (DNA-binding transcriptional repressor) of toxin-antitoxin stability system